MRQFVAVVCLVGAALIAAATAPAGALASRSAAQRLGSAMSRGLRLDRRNSGAEVLDLTTGHVLYGANSEKLRWPASVEKLYTTSTALARFGASTRLSTTVLADGSIDNAGAFTGTLYLRGGGDPTFGSEHYDRFAYGTGATMQRLVHNLVGATGITAVHGSIVGDESVFDSLRGTAPYGYAPALDIEGLLSGLAYDRGLVNEPGTAYQAHPAAFAAQQFAAALQSAGVRVPKQTRIYAGVTPPAATPLAAVRSPTISWLIRLTNTPSDNFFAEMLLKGVGAEFGGAGTTAAGAAVVRSQMATSFDIHPRLEDGSGLSRKDLTTPAQIIALLKAQASNRDFTNSLSVAGETGTMQIGLHATAAQGRCRGKTGTLTNVANEVGYCTARDGHTLAFAFLMNLVDPVAGHAFENRMTVSVANYSG